MGERELIAAKAKVVASQTDLQTTIVELKHRLKPSTLVNDAWHSVRDKGSEYSEKGVNAVSGRPAVAGGAGLAVLLFLLRGPLARLLGGIFGKDSGRTGRVKADLLQTDTDYDLTAPVVVAK